MVHLSRLAEDLIIWSSSEFGYISLAEDLTSGSSIMPQKRNPDTAELLRGKTGKVLGNLVQILSILKNQPLAYNRDLQEDKPPLFDAAETTLVSLELAARFFSGMKVNGARTEESCKKGFLLATELADYLAKKGMPFRAAHAVVKKIVQSLRDASGDEFRSLNSLTPEELKRFSPLFENDAFLVLDPRKVAEARNSYGGTGRSALAQQISRLRSLLRK
jgi:argininosuccinate lyase